MLNLRFPFALMLALGATAFCAAGDLKMDIHQAFEGFLPSSGTTPVVVEIKNTGPDARGVLHVSSESFRTDYPVELPSGSIKSIYTFPTVNYSEVQYSLDTNQGSVNTKFSPEQKWEQRQNVVLMISDSPGELSFLRTKGDSNPSQAQQVQDAYVKPGNAPTRPVGYVGIGAIVLGPGSERLSDPEVAAIKLYLLTGGSLFFIGGASAPILKDPRWRDAIPVRDTSLVNLPTSTALAKIGKSDPPPATYMTGTPMVRGDATFDGSTLISASRSFGLGNVTYLSFNLFETPLKKWPGRALGFNSLLHLNALGHRKTFINQFSREQNGDYLSAGVTVAPAVTSRVAVPKEEDPFSTTLPPVENIFLILGIYFIVVVPINFLVLKKLNRAELAWFTAPVISLIFAGILFAQAQSLYSAKMSTASQGILIAQQGEPTAMFVGSSQVFIPIAGSYDLKFAGVDSVGVVENEDPYSNYSYRNRNALEINPVDIGEILVPNLRANNLAFKEILYRQTTPMDDWFEVKTNVPGESYSVTNNSPYTVLNATIYLGQKRILSTQKLTPGGKITLSGKFRTAYDDKNSLSQFMREGQLAIAGTVEGFRPGPQIGREVSKRSRVQLAYMLSPGGASGG